jgi:hypothetical protein
MFSPPSLIAGYDRRRNPVACSIARNPGITGTGHIPVGID